MLKLGRDKYVFTINVFIWLFIFIYQEEFKKREEESLALHCKDLDYNRFMMVTQLCWEDNIIWDGEQSKKKVLAEHKKNAEFAGWIPSTKHRTFLQFAQCQWIFVIVKLTLLNIVLSCKVYHFSSIFLFYLFSLLVIKLVGCINSLHPELFSQFRQN